MSADPADRETRLDRLCTEYLVAAEAGAPPDRATWLARHPDLATELAEFLDCLNEVGSRVAPLRAVAGGEETIDLHPQNPDPETAAVVAPPGYEILGVIAKGGMGVVYRAREVELNRVVALKMIRAGELVGESAVQRFRLEAEAAAGFDHPHIVPVYDVGVTDAGGPYFSMKLVEGRTLSDWIAEGWSSDGVLRMSPGLRTGIALLAAVARAVHYAHQRGFLHRDLKPANVLIDAAGVPYVTDFGLAKRITDEPNGHSLTQDGGLVGTLGYMAPEQARGEKALTTAADVYALGAILFHVLTGRPLRPGRTLAEVSAHLGHETPRPRAVNPRTDRYLEAICLKCLADDPAARFGSAEALADDLDLWAQGRATRTLPPGPTRRLWMWARRRPDVAALSALTLLVFLTGVALVTWKWRAEVDARYEAQAQASRSAAIVAGWSLEEGTDGESENLGVAMLWWARSFHLAPKRYPRERSAARTNLAALAGRVHTLREMWELPTAKAQMALAPDGSWAAVVDGDAVRLLDPRTGNEVGSVLTHPGAKVAAFSPDGGTLATAGNGVVRVWDLRAPAPAPRVVKVNGTVRLLAVGPGGKQFAVVGEGNDVLFFADGAPVGNLLPHPQPVHALAFDRSGSRLATGCADKKARVWTSANGQPAEFSKHDDAVRAVAFSPDGTKLLTGSDDHVARVWDVSGVVELVRLQHQDYVRAVAYSPDGLLVATGGSDSAAQVWEANTGRRVGQLLRHGSSVEAVSFAAGGAELVIWGAGDVARVWAVSRAARAEQTFAIGSDVYAVAVLPKGEILAGTKRGANLFGANDREVKFRTLPVPSGAEVWAAASRPDGELSAIGGWAEGEKGWLTLARPDGRDARSFALPHPVRALSFSPTTPRLLASTATTTAGGLWACDTADPRATPRALPGSGPVWAVAHTGDGSRYATSTGYGEVRVWHAATDQPDGEPLHQPWRVVALGFPSSSKRLVTASTDQQVRVWDVPARTVVAESTAHRGAVWAVAISPDGRLVATAGRDRCVRVWDADTGVPVGAPLRHRDTVWTVAFGRDGTDLWSGSADGTVRHWRTPDTTLDVPDAHIETWVEVVTGLHLDGDRVRALGLSEWRERRERLSASGVVWRVE